MRVIRSTDMTKDECRRHAERNEWLMRESRTPAGAGYFWHRARYWRSLYYVAKPAGTPNEPSSGPG